VSRTWSDYLDYFFVMPKKPSDSAINPQFAERLRAIVGTMSNVAFARLASVSEKMIRKYLAGESKPGLEALLGLAYAGGVEAQWLATGEGPKELQRPPRQPLSLATLKDTTFAGALDASIRISDQGPPEVIWIGSGEVVEIPEYGVTASMGPGAENHIEEVVGHWALPPRYLRELGVAPADACVISARGDSMAGTIHDGDRLLVDLSRREIGEGIYIMRIGDTLLAKRLQRKADGSVMIRGDNPAYGQEIVPATDTENLIILGRVVARLGRV